MCRNNHFYMYALLFLLFMLGCAAAPQPLWNEVTARTDKLSKKDAFNAVTAILVDKGFDVKMANKDIGLITTEFKKFAAVGDDPPFDLYLQIKAKITETPDGKVKIALTPLAKDVNRLNSAAFEEHPLYSFTEEQVAKPKRLSAYGRAALKGHLLFLNVAQGIAETFGLGMEQLELNIQQVASK